KVVVPASATDTPHGDFIGFHLEDTAGIIIEAAGKCNIQFHKAAKQGRFAREPLYVAHDDLELIDAGKSGGRCPQHFPKLFDFLAVGTLQLDDGLHPFEVFSAETAGQQLLVHPIQADLIQLIDGYGHVDNQLGLPQYLRDASEELAVVQLNGKIAQSELGQCLVVDEYELGFVEQAIGPHHVHIALIEFTITPPLRPSGAPYGLYLKPLERQGQLVLVHHHVAGEGDRKVVA